MFANIPAPGLVSSALPSSELTGMSIVPAVSLTVIKWLWEGKLFVVKTVDSVPKRAPKGILLNPWLEPFPAPTIALPQRFGKPKVVLPSPP